MNTFPAGNSFAVWPLAIGLCVLLLGAGLIGAAWWPSHTLLALALLWLRLVFFLLGGLLVVAGIIGVLRATGLMK